MLKNKTHTLVLASMLLFTAMGFANNNTDLNVFESVEVVKIIQDKWTAEALKKQFNTIQEQFEAAEILFNAKEISKASYKRQLKRLRKKELKLFKIVKKHTFKDHEMVEYNYWHQGVLKFPTRIEQELLKLTQS
ncbi:hypothetical protein [Siansivirga zeaxanthinifaciens]|uniref:DUF4168 domain-containing protein n=1 Tax=Siansivirga zeaxanthinifaciens CC-SAMT-1 TaxID=1454006 RepID=A0A0C5WPH8_9FLAO|nr:hypothetical protein [Siansivirga zeaxanthinifaciens]AJR04810.1 hypothetical protein AW14_06410 [Siansivirga zeaxanthinifaciens CC-SAMT-1]